MERKGRLKEAQRLFALGKSDSKVGGDGRRGERASPRTERIRSKEKLKGEGVKVGIQGGGTVDPNHPAFLAETIKEENVTQEAAAQRN